MIRKLKDRLLDLFYITFLICATVSMVVLVWIGFTSLVKAEGPKQMDPVVEEEIFVEPEPLEPEPVEFLVIEEPEYDWRVCEQLAVGIYREGGGDNVCDDCRVRIGDVMLNRVADDRFPDTLEEVLTQKGQYGTMYWDGITFPKRAAQPEEFHAVQRAYDTAKAIMTGTHSELYGAGYIYQSEFPDLGHDAFEHCGIYFAKG